MKKIIIFILILIFSLSCKSTSNYKVVFGHEDRSVGREIYPPIPKSFLDKTQKFTKHISRNNFINAVLYYETFLVANVTDDDLKKAYHRLDTIIDLYKKVAKKNDDPKTKLLNVYMAIAKMKIPSQRKDTDIKYFIESIRLGQKDCDTGSFLYLALAYEFKWPLYGIHVPKHFFVRWMDKKASFNFETNLTITNSNGVVSYDARKNKEYLLKNLYPSNENYRREYKATVKMLSNPLNFNQTLLHTYQANLFNKGGRLLQEKKIKQAIFLFKLLIQMNPSNPKAYSIWGNALQQQENYKEALNKFKIALKLQAKNKEYSDAIAITYFNWGIFYTKKNEYSKAIEKFSKALELKPQDPNYKDNLSNTFYNFGIMNLNKEKFAIAAAKFLRALKINPQNADYKKALVAVYFNWGLSYYNKKQILKAKQKFKMVLKLDPQNSQAVKLLKRINQ